MTTIILQRGRHVVATQAWTAAANQQGKGLVEIAYVWGADGVSFFGGATGVERVTLAIGMDFFLHQLEKAGPVLDLRRCQ